MKQAILLIGLVLLVGCVNDRYMDGWNDRIKAEYHYPSECDSKYYITIDYPDLKLQVSDKGLIKYNKTISDDAKLCSQMYLYSMYEGIK